MEMLKQKAIKVISELPEDVDMEEIMYRPYVIDKVEKEKRLLRKERKSQVRN